jgi:hypothetical protein
MFHVTLDYMLGKLNLQIFLECKICAVGLHTVVNTHSCKIESPLNLNVLSNFLKAPKLKCHFYFPW